MQTSFAVNYTKAIAGLTVGAHRSKGRVQPLAKQTWTGTIGTGTVGNLVLRLVDDATQQSYDLTVAMSTTTLATSLAEIQTAWRANGKFNDLFSISHDGSTVYTIAARQPGKSWTHSMVSAPGSFADTIAETVASGGSGPAFGLAVARGSNDNEFGVLGASSTINDIIGVTKRTDANHFHDLPVDLGDDDPDASDLTVRGKMQSLVEQGRVWVTAESAMAPGGRVYVRRALTSGAGAVGGFRGAVAGSAQTLTITPIVNQAIYGFSFTFVYQGVRHRIQAVYMPTDGTTSIADACGGLFDAVSAEITAKGLSSVLTPADNATTLTVVTAAGYAITEPSANVWYLDTEAATVSLSNGTEDVDTIDASDLFEIESTAAAGELVLIKVKLL